ncbi:conserved protein of unknown function (plasmid) [Cupriavidus taiwanensis]|uniref:DUF2855 domain-containing protein n=1 Tax=Cupriavidus taiwanensis TaxID=164546 RepID=A0A375IMR0_9BURK|nr:DUF2855 family protein [Cupriavidus taiwanensis]SPK75946.1 conserved protein of unknown function [Cupriavidus taiwanensis]
MTQLIRGADQRLLTRKNALGESRLESTTESHDASLVDGEIVLRLDRFALTTNNITYAAFGDAMQYWDFFPTGKPEWGHMPVWGFADVVASTVEGVDPGERFYGYFPIASHVRMQPERVTDRGFYDGAAHRKPLVSAYNQYTRVSHDAAYDPALENYQMLYRPLFITSFMLADFLQDNAFFGARRLVFSSASSKTAYGTAFCLDEAAGLTLTALTSTSNRDFVDGLSAYHESLAYDELEVLPTDVPTLYVDFSGDAALRRRVHAHFAAALVYDCYAGSAQNTDFLKAEDLSGPAPRFYFAPVQIRKRNAEWGPAVVNEKFNAAQRRFIDHVREPSRRWLTVVEEAGMAAAQQRIAALHAGKTHPRDGYVIHLR